MDIVFTYTRERMHVRDTSAFSFGLSVYRPTYGNERVAQGLVRPHHVLAKSGKSTARQLRNGTSAMARKESTNAAHLVATATRQALRQAEPAGDVPCTRPEDPSRDSRGGETTFTQAE